MKRRPFPSLLLTAVFLGTIAAVHAFTFDHRQVEDSRTRFERMRLLDLLRQIDEYNDRSSHSRNTPDSIPPRVYSNPSQERHELSKKNDVSVLPPWNEFCRMMKITNCVHSQH